MRNFFAQARFSIKLKKALATLTRPRCGFWERAAFAAWDDHLQTGGSAFDISHVNSPARVG